MNDDAQTSLPPEAKELMRAMHLHLHERTVGVVSFSRDGRPGDIGSGTLIQIGHRYFVATAAHVVAPVPLERIALIHTAQDSDRRVPLLGSNSTGGDGADDVDVAWIELAALEAGRLGKTFVSADRLGTIPVHDAGSCYLVGYPRDWIEGLEQRTVGAQSMLYRTLVLEKSQWPEKGREDYDIFLSYLHGTILDDQPSVTFPEPHGLSGGGIWWGRLSPSGIWSPDLVRLVGIDRSWHPGDRWACGTRIHHWLKLVGRDFPDLREEIRQWGELQEKP